MDAFELRDGMLALLRDGNYELSPTAAGLLWFLLFHGIYDRGSRWYSYVNIRMTSQDVLAIALGRGRTSVWRGLNELEEKGFIKRHKRYNHANGNRLSDSIELATPDDFCFNCRTRGHNEDSCEEPMPKNET